MSRGELLRFLRARLWAVEASVDAQGQPQAAAIDVAVTDRFELVFDTLSGARKAAHLRANPRVALVTGRDDGQTAQVEGLADEPVGDELRQLRDIYLQSCPDGHERAVQSGIAHFRVSPLWTRFSDLRTTPTHGGGV